MGGPGCELREGLGLERAVALHSERLPGRGAPKVASGGQAWEEGPRVVKRGDEPGVAGSQHSPQLFFCFLGGGGWFFIFKLEAAKGQP